MLKQVLGQFADYGRASAYGVANQLGLPPEKVRVVCQNARRAGRLAAVGSEPRMGSDRPAVVYALADQSAQSQLPSASRWHEALSFWDRSLA
jgi:hypothetical protein